MKSKYVTAVSVVMVSLLGGLSACGSDSDGTSNPNIFIGLQREDPLRVGDVSLPDQTTGASGRFTTKAAPGELLMVYFGYTNCPDLCPTTLADLKMAKKRIGKAADVVDLAFVTVDPERDTAEKLNTYLSSFTDRFHVLRTTDFDELQQAEDKFLAVSRVIKNDDGSVDVEHTASAYMVDANGTVVVEWPFGIGSDGMEHDLRILLKGLS